MIIKVSALQFQLVFFAIYPEEERLQKLILIRIKNQGRFFLSYKVWPQIKNQSNTFYPQENTVGLELGF